ncbi:MAG TPA: tail assembly chaperone [Massilibacterium sp.]|nr:tail assembly chaperone [Massilibacterium sp.]
MKLDVAGTSYEVKMGYKAVRKLNEFYKLEQDVEEKGQEATLKMSFGQNFLVMYLQQGDLEAVVNFFLAGLDYLNPGPSEDLIIEAAEKFYLENDDAAEQCLKELDESGFFKKQLENMKMSNE